MHCSSSQHGPAVQTGSQGTFSSPTGSKKIINKKEKVFKLFTEAEETIRISKEVDHLAGNKLEESKEPYVSEHGRGAWQEHTASSSSSSSSWSVGSRSPSPGRNIKGMGRGNVKSAAAPVVMKVGDINTYHVHYLPDCRQTNCNEIGENCTEVEIEQPITGQYQD
jgi:hypothetical protein